MRIEGNKPKGKNIACVASVSVRFRSKERGTRVKTAQAKEWGGGEEERKETFFLPLPLPLFHFLALVSFLARPKPRILVLASFLGLFLLRNQTETPATQAMKNINKNTTNKQKKNVQRKRIWPPGHRDSNLHYNRLLREKPTPRPMGHAAGSDITECSTNLERLLSWKKIFTSFKNLIAKFIQKLCSEFLSRRHSLNVGFFLIPFSWLLKSPLLIPRISREKKSYHLSNFALLIIYGSCFVSFLTLYTSR